MTWFFSPTQNLVIHPFHLFSGNNNERPSSRALKERRKSRSGRELVFLGAKVNSLMEGDDMSVLEETRGESRCERRIAEELSPFGEIKIGGDEGAFMIAPVIHQTEEIVYLRGLGRIDVAKLIDQQEIQTGEFLKETFGGAVRVRRSQFLEEILSGKAHGGPSGIKGFEHQGLGDTAFSDPRRAREDDGFASIQEIQLGQL